jgi:hypothetical protein
MECEAMCKTSEEVAFSIKRDMEIVNKRCFSLETSKTDVDAYEKFKRSSEGRLLTLENNFDVAMNKAKALENWIDVYMPLRL